MEWYSQSRKQHIDNFIDILCAQEPDVAKKVLAIGFNNFMFWFNQSGDTTLKDAACGCLIGASAIAAYQVHKEKLEAHKNDFGIKGLLEYSYDPADPLAVMCESVKELPLERIGFAVLRECEDDNCELVNSRVAAMKEYLNNRFREKLGLTEKRI